MYIILKNHTELLYIDIRNCTTHEFQINTIACKLSVRERASRRAVWLAGGADEEHDVHTALLTDMHINISNTQSGALLLV